MSKDRTPDASVLDLMDVLWRHKIKAILFACATLAVVAVYVVLTPKKYQSDAKLFFREKVGLDPTVLTSQARQIQMPDYEINSALEMIKSRTLLGKAVDELGVDTVLAKPGEYPFVSAVKSQINSLRQPLKQSVQSAWPATAATSSVTPEPRDDAIDRLQDSLAVSSPRETTVINVSCEANTPQLAQQIVATVVNVYVGEHMRFHRTTGSLELFAEQTESVRQEMMEANQELVDFKSGRGVVSIEGQLQLLEAQKSDIEQEQLRVDRQYASSQARYRALAESVESLEEMVVTAREADSNEAADGMRQQLYDLEIVERELTAKYSEEHPRVKEARRQLETVRSIFEAESQSRESVTTAVNPNWLQLQLSLLQEASQLAALESSRNSLGRQRTELAEKIKDANGFAIQVAQLQRKADLLTESYQAHSANLEQARIDTAIEDQRISNVSVVQDASLIQIPVGASKKVIAAVGLFAAIFGGAGVALFCEYLDPRLKTPPEVEQVLELPVLISIPRSACERVCV